MTFALRYENDPAVFQERVGSFLCEHEAENNLPLGLIAGMIAGVRYSDEPPLMATVEAEEIQAVALRTPPHKLVLSTSRSDEATSFLARELHAGGCRLPGITACDREAWAFARQWSVLTGAKVRQGKGQRIYRLDHVILPAPKPGRLHRCGEADVELAAKWLREFDREAEVEISSDVRRFIGPRDRGLFFWIDGSPVTMAGYMGPTPHGIRIGGVYTPPELRRRGYASACVAALNQRLLEEGRKFCFLYTDLANPISNNIYQAIGYRPVCDAPMLKFSP
jgi:predicted GNAT family acetyltransferase